MDSFRVEYNGKPLVPRCINVDTKDRKWLCVADTSGTPAGLWVYGGGRSRLLSNDYNQGNLPTTLVYSVVYDESSDVVWIGTASGIATIGCDVFSADCRAYGLVLSSYNPPARALWGVSVYHVSLSPTGQLWCSTEYGVYVIDHRSAVVRALFSTDSFPLPSSIVRKAVFHSSSGKVLLITQAGGVFYWSEASAPSPRCDDVIVVPNPVEGEGAVYFLNLPASATVKIVTPAGALIAEGTPTGGTWVWNVTSTQGERVTAGVYHALVIGKRENGKRTTCITTFSVIK